MQVYIYIYCMYTNLKYFSFKDCKASRVERTSFTKAYRPRWWCQSRASWTFMWQAFHARRSGGSWSCRNTVPPVIWWSNILCVHIHFKHDRIDSRQYWRLWRSLDCFLERELTADLSSFELWSWQCLQDFSILNSNRPCLQGPHASTFHGVVRSLSKNISPSRFLPHPLRCCSCHRRS